MLELQNIQVRYGYMVALKDVSLKVGTNTVTALLGANGAGKSTTLRTISGLNRAYRGKIELDTGEKKEIQNIEPSKIVNMGIVLTPEGRQIFPELTVHENLLAGAYTVKSKSQVKQSTEEVFSLFPVLNERRKQLGGTLSGGEQQMLAIGRSLMASPNLLMLDEPSLGLAPKIVEQIFDILIKLKSQGKTIFLVEQNANLALHICDYAYILEVGNVTLEGDGQTLLRNESVQKKYLGG